MTEPTPVAPPPPARTGVGRLVDRRYRLLEHIADGGMASVWRALDERLEREVAVKILRPGLAEDAVFATRFRDEALAAARLNDPRVVAVYDQGRDGADMFLVMELVNGRTLREVVAEDAPLEPRAALDILRTVAEALGVAHAAGLVHGDVKPENVIIRDDGQVKVADLGLARAVTGATATTLGAESILGTVSYLAPEQVEHGHNDARSDVYAAGILAFELLTGTKPYAGDSPIHVAYQHVHGTVPTPSSLVARVPTAVDELVATVTAKDPAQRPADGRALAALVRDTRRRLDDDPSARPSPRAAHEPTVPFARRSVPPPGDATVPVPHGSTRPTERSSPARRRRWLFLLPLLLVLALAAGAGWWFLAGPGATTTVPDVARTTLAEARSRLDAAHLEATTTEAFSETSPRGTVLSVSPTTGTALHRGEAVDLTVSKGPERYAVPDLAGATVAEGRRLLEAAHLRLGGTTEAWSETVPAGSVVSATPPPGTSVRPRTDVAVVVSKGREPITVPTLTGRTLDDARTTATRAGLRLTDAGAPVYSTTVPKGSVVSQRPRTGTLHRGDTVTVTLSKGPEMVTVPSVIGRSVADARAALTAAGFRVEEKTVFGGLLQRVRFQSVDGGSSAVKGSVITVTVV